MSLDRNSEKWSHFPRSCFLRKKRQDYFPIAISGGTSLLRKAEREHVRRWSRFQGLWPGVPVVLASRWVSRCPMPPKSLPKVIFDMCRRLYCPHMSSRWTRAFIMMDIFRHNTPSYHAVLVALYSLLAWENFILDFGKDRLLEYCPTQAFLQCRAGGPKSSCPHRASTAYYLLGRDDVILEIEKSVSRCPSKGLLCFQAFLMGKIVVCKRIVFSEPKRQGVTINAPSEVLHNVFSHKYPQIDGVLAWDYNFGFV